MKRLSGTSFAFRHCPTGAIPILRNKINKWDCEEAEGRRSNLRKKGTGLLDLIPEDLSPFSLPMTSLGGSETTEAISRARYWNYTLLAMTVLLLILSVGPSSSFAQNGTPPSQAAQKTTEGAKEEAASEEGGQSNLPFRDPFQTNLPSPEGPISEEGAIYANLEGISIGREGTLALINGELYREGETKGGVKVTQIKKKEVDIVINGVSQTLRMIPAPVERYEKPLSTSGGTTSGERVPTLRVSTSSLDETKKESSSQTVEDELEGTGGESRVEEESYV